MTTIRPRCPPRLTARHCKQMLVAASPASVRVMSGLASGGAIVFVSSARPVLPALAGAASAPPSRR